MTGFTYKSYSFTDKDPIIDEIRTIYQDSGVNYAWVHDHSNVSPMAVAPKLIQHAKPKRKGGSAGLGSRGGADINNGMARIIMDLLSDGKPHTQGELKPLVKKEGYSPSGAASRLNKLMAHGLIHQPDYGLWAIGEKPKKTSAA